MNNNIMNKRSGSTLRNICTAESNGCIIFSKKCSLAFLRRYATLELILHATKGLDLVFFWGENALLPFRKLCAIFIPE